MPGIECVCGGWSRGRAAAEVTCPHCRAANFPAAAAGPDPGTGRPRRLLAVRDTVPFAPFTAADRLEQARHLNADLWLYKPGHHRFVCSLLGALYQELGDRPDLQELVLEVTWMARRMNDFGQNQVDLDWTSPPREGAR
jgi:hypothetical protein